MFRLPRARTSILVLWGLLIISCGVDDDGPTGAGNDDGVFINELLASNDAGAVDPDFGERSDWIELYNRGSSTVTVGGWYLTDDLAAPDRWMIPSGTDIAAGGFLLIWADDRDTAGTALHANFKLSAGGEEVGLFDDELNHVDRFLFGALDGDVSYGRASDGGAALTAFSSPTPGSSNSGAPVNSPPVIQSVSIAPTVPVADVPVVVTATISDGDGAVDTAELRYSTGLGFAPIAMLPGVEGRVFTASIPGFVEGKTVRFYVIATDDDGDEVISPPTAPDVSFSYTVSAESTLPAVVINELVADNVAGHADQDGEFDDWVELWNWGGDTLDLGGMYLTDDFSEPGKWSFPANTALAPGEHLLVWADNDVEQDGLHASFKLGASGEEVGLYTSGWALIDSVTFPAQAPDTSFARSGDGGSVWEFDATPTPEGANQ